MTTAIPANEARMDAWTAAAATGGRLAHLAHGADEAAVASGIVSDTRAVRPGAAFVALRGARFDGHAFLGAAVEAGAVLVVCERGHAAGHAQLASVDVVEVDDTLVAWGDLARAHLRSFRRAGGRAGCRVLCLTGSAGKTTTKELAAALLGTVAPVHATFGNLNNRIGAPAVAFGVTASTRFCVIEAGMSEPGEIERIASFIEPDVALVLNATLAHAGGVGGTRADVAREKGALFAALESSGVAVANADDAAVMGQLARSRAARAVTFGSHSSATYQLVDRSARNGGKLGSQIRFITPDGERAVELSIPGRAAAIDLVAAWAAAEALAGRALDARAAQAALDRLEPPDGRMRVVRLPSGALLFDDSYNANPASVANALHALHEVATRESRRAIVVLGEMRELGETSAREHAKVGELVADAAVALLVCVGASSGGETLHALASARARGVETLAAADADEAAALVAPLIHAGDLVLVKGSRGAATDRVVCALEVAP